MIPKEVFHYTGSGTLKKIISGKKLKIGRLKFTNDPKESKEHFFDSFISSSDQEWETSDEFQRLYQTATPIKLNEWKVLCISKNHPDLESGKISKYQNPFLSGSCRPRMWANYADKHTGVCLKFSGDKLDRQIRKELDKTCQVFCGNVEYNDQMLIDSTSPGVNVDEILKLSDIQLKEWLGNYFESNYEAVFLKKSKDWESEYEFRWLIHSEENKDEFISISDALEEVIVGSDFPETEYPILFKFCKDLDIPIYKMVWNNGIPDRKNLSALIYQKEKPSMPGHQRNIRNLVYFECDSMRELYDSIKTWQDENHKLFLSLNLQQDREGNFCCIAFITPEDGKQRVTHTEYEEAMARFERKAIRIIVREKNIGAIVDFVDPIIPGQKILAIQNRLMKCTTVSEIRTVFDEEF